jgi:hypothetical protein
MPNHINPEFHSDNEHVEGEAELGEGEEVALGVAGGLGFVPGKESVLRFGPEETKKGRAEEDTCDHFGDNLGLAQSGGKSSNDPAEEEDDGQLEEAEDGQMDVVHEGERWNLYPG